MVQVRQLLLIVAAASLVSGAEPRRAATLSFYPDDPLWKMPPSRPVANPHKRRIDQLYDFVSSSIIAPGEHPPKTPSRPAVDANTLGEVPDSEWYTNRHRLRRMTIAELTQGPARGHEPAPPFRVTGAKTEGITPGFQMVDSKGRRYLCKPDPASNPEMATAADVIGSKFFYAFGYNVPENYILYFTRDQIGLDSKATLTGLNGKPRPMNEGDLRRSLRHVQKDGQGRYRVMASLFIEGDGIGPFKWYGTRRDDPNDIYPHEHMRVLRGLYVFCSWLNHTDIKANNTYDSVTNLDGVRAIKHHLIDFGASLGSDSDEAKDARLGHRFMIETDSSVLVRMATLGLYSPAWERARFPHIPAVGHLDAETFVADKWTSNYPNTAFLNRLRADSFWAAKQVMAFTGAEIRAMVATGQFTYPRAADVIARVLEKRREKIGRYYFDQVLPLDSFEVQDGKLRFKDLAAHYGFIAPREFRARWFLFDNQSAVETPISAVGFAVPRSERGQIVGIEIQAESEKRVKVYLREGLVIGIERT